MENEELKNEVLENEGKEVSALATVQDFGALSKSTSTKAELFTNITDQKKIFNLDSHVDNLINDCEGELIRVKEVLIKRYEKPMKEPIYDEETGEILKDKEITMACILIDDNNKSYATGSKVFTIQMMRYLQMFGITNEGFEIKVVKNKTEKGNKALGFELV
ncbi:MAG: hypothetical protein SOY33_05560 [Candidatus Onthovivens sp.]|nr:hypothetical protein [Bacilli bacterium]